MRVPSLARELEQGPVQSMLGNSRLCRCSDDVQGFGSVSRNPIVRLAAIGRPPPYTANTWLVPGNRTSVFCLSRFEWTGEPHSRMF
jgi:hypothetical protein